MRQIVITIGFLLGTLHMLQAQSWLIQGTIENGEEGPVLLASFYGDRFRMVDSMDTKSGFFYFMLPEDTAPGIYRIIYADRVDSIRMQNRFVEFIFNREHMELFISSTDMVPVIYFENSLENQVYREFMEFELEYEARLISVYNQLYPDRKGANQDVVERYDAMQIERESFMDSMTQLYPDLYAVRIMNAFRAPMIPGEISHVQRIDTLKECFFNQASIDDPALLYAPVYTFKLIDYLSLYQDYELTKEEQEAAFIEAVDWIMVNVSGDGDLRSFVVGFLLDGFEMLDMEAVQIHIADNYLDESCETDVVELVLSRMEGYKRMTPGQQAPDFVIHDAEGKNHQLSKLEHAYVLVLFWSSTCDACQKLMPELNDWYLSENICDLEVVAISIDTSVVNFEHRNMQLNPAWITVHDPLGWHGKLSADYNIYATPSLFLLDGERTILARPTSFRQFQRAIRKLLP
ncbi:MAG: TlpA disulfide reductase family protein [Bacteroidota bacterium]|nr:TlpA disulfide reductase family protein [Bacteroidota bacterium]